MSSPSPSGTPLWLQLVAEPMYAVVHEPVGARQDITAVILPTFGWDEAGSYRARRRWATAFAEAGFPTVRFDLPGSEDSVGEPLSLGRFESWVEAVDAVCRWARAASAPSRLAVVGIGLGGLLALEAARRGTPIEDLVLWGVPSRGAAYLRELRMYAETMARDGREPEREDGAIAIGGYPISRETMDALAAVELTGVPPADGAGRRILMVGRDAHGVDRRLAEHFRRSGAEVTELPADDYATMMTFPGASIAPKRTISESTRWLGRSARPARDATARLWSDAVVDQVTFEHLGTTIRERHVSIETALGRYVGISSEPVGAERADLGLLSINAGAVRRTGPNRTWTDLCRRSAARGIPSLRIDIAGTGDAGGHFVRIDDLTETDERQITDVLIALLDTLVEQGFATRFVMPGLSLGAYWDLKTALRDPRVCGLVLLNMVAFEWTPEQFQERARRYALGPLRSVFRKQINRQGLLGRDASEIVGGVAMTIRGVAAAAEQSQRRAALDAFDRVTAAGTRMLMLFSESELLYGQMRRLGLTSTAERWPGVEVVALPTRDHDLRPMHIQAEIRDRTDRFLEELLAEDPGGTGSQPA